MRTTVSSQLVLLVLGLICFTLCLPAYAAAGKPDIIRHEGTYLERTLHVIVQWQSANPVVKVRITAGREAKEIKVDEYDNKRNPAGYEGEVTVVVPVDPAMFQVNVPYVVQLEDDLLQRSNLINGRVDLPKTEFAGGGMMPHHGGGDAWGQGHVRANVTAQPGGGAGDMVDKLLGVMERHDVPPSIDEIKVNQLSAQGVSFSNKANDDKGLREINIKVFDNTGKESGTQQLANLGKVWQGSSQTFMLQPGNYRVTMQAVDTAGNTSPEKTAVFTMGTITPPPPNQGSLLVTILPDPALKIGAQWKLSGKDWLNTGVKSDLPPGKYKVEYKEVAGWTTPAVQEVEIIAGQNAQITGTYQQAAAKKGALQVAVVPAAAVGLGAKWRLDGGAWMVAGTKVEATEGKHKIEFAEIAGWQAPAVQEITVTAGKDSTATGAYGRIYTVNKDFEEGTLVGLEFQTVKDQLQLTKSATTLPFIWVPNSNDGTISKVDTTTGTELGRYRTGPGSGSPSRTTVDLQGNCWVGNRNTGTVVKVGLLENGQCVDRNKNGKIDTSSGSNLLAWGEDECVLLEVSLNKGSEVTCTVGQKCPNNGSGPRGIAIDANNNLWAGTYNQGMYYQINGSTGAILKKVDVSPHRPYGGIVDKNGLLWSADLSGNVLRLNTTTGAFSQIQLSGSQAYGMGLNRDGRLYVSGWCSNKLMMINTSTGAVAWTKDTGDSCSRGVAVTNDGDVWVANSGSNTVSRWSADGTKKETIKGFQHPTGVATDANGKVWVVDYNSSNIYRINPASNAVELTKAVAGPHYGYSDMTGIVSRSMTTKTGTWTVTLDSQGDTTAWDSLLWAGNVPQGSSLKVRVRSSKDNVTWSAWEDVLAATSLKATPAARYLQMEATLQLSAGEVSPILYDLMVKTK